MVNRLRKETQNEKLPFLTAQLNRYTDSTTTAENNVCWGKIRESQRQAARKLEEVYIVPTIDCTLSDTIHNSSSSNIMLGERIAKLALSEIYGKSYNAKAADVSSAMKTGINKVELIFENVYGILNFWNLAAKDISIKAADDLGKLAIKSYSATSNSVSLEFIRNMQGKVFIHNAYQCNPTYFVPKDTANGVPMLCFYNVEVE
jgi:sialate O-acetylesterase